MILVSPVPVHNPAFGKWGCVPAAVVRRRRPLIPGGSGGSWRTVILQRSAGTGGGVSQGVYSVTVDTQGEVCVDMSGGFTDYLRGVCYPLHAGTCPPPRDPGQQPFFIRQGPCTIGADSLENCTLVATVKATFDAAAGTVTIPVPLDAIKGKPGSKIGPGSNAAFGTTIYASPSAVISSANLPHDAMLGTGTFVVPKGK